MRRIAPNLGILVLIALFAAACGTADDLTTADEPSVTQDDVPRTPDGLTSCADISPIPSTVLGALGGRTNPDDRVMGVIYTYAQENQDVFAGIWIDRDNAGTIVVAFTDDPESHFEALNARGPRETDEVGVQPPPPITDARPLGERDDIVFEVVQAQYTEAELRSMQNEITNAALDIDGAGLNGTGARPNYGVFDLYLVDPTDAALADIAELIGNRPVCVEIERTRPPPTGPLDIIGATGDPVELPDGLEIVEWVLDPAFPAPGPSDTELHVLATERGCASGQPMGDRLQGPQVVETDDAVRIAFAVVVQAGAQDCPGNPAAPVTITLAEPLGDRTLVDGVNPTRQPVMGEGFDDAEPDNAVEQPLIGQELDGEGWRLVSSTGFIEEWSPPVAATSAENIGLLQDTFWDLPIDYDGVDLANEILIAQPVIKQFGDDEKCGPHIIANVRVEEGAFAYDIESPQHVDGSACEDPDTYQVFVIALERASLPDTLLLPNRNARIEVEVR